MYFWAIIGKKAAESWGVVHMISAQYSDRRLFMKEPIKRGVNVESYYISRVLSRLWLVDLAVRILKHKPLAFMVNAVLSTSIQLTVRPLNPVSKRYLVPLTKPASFSDSSDYMETGRLYGHQAKEKLARTHVPVARDQARWLWLWKGPRLPRDTARLWSL